MKSTNWPEPCSPPPTAGSLPPAVLRSPRPIVRAAIWAALIGAVVVLAAVEVGRVVVDVGRAWFDPRKETNQ